MGLSDQIVTTAQGSEKALEHLKMEDNPPK